MSVVLFVYHLISNQLFSCSNSEHCSSFFLLLCWVFMTVQDMPSDDVVSSPSSSPSVSTPPDFKPPTPSQLSLDPLPEVIPTSREASSQSSPATTPKSNISLPPLRISPRPASPRTPTCVEIEVDVLPTPRPKLLRGHSWVGPDGPATIVKQQSWIEDTRSTSSRHLVDSIGMSSG